jgi:hypothetical protein
MDDLIIPRNEYFHNNQLEEGSKEFWIQNEDGLVIMVNREQKIDLSL